MAAYTSSFVTFLSSDSHPLVPLLHKVTRQKKCCDTDHAVDELAGGA